VSSGKETHHINIQYFLITDRITRKEVAIKYCPTKEMVAEYFTKPLQGELFYNFRDQIIGVVSMDTITGDHRSVLNDKSSHPSSSGKPNKVSPKAIINMQPKRASTASKKTTTRSWVNVVKSRRSYGSDGRIMRLM
jgi:hypothetical protein